MAGWVFLEEKRGDSLGGEGWRCAASLFVAGCLNFVPTAPSDIMA